MSVCTSWLASSLPLKVLLNIQEKAIMSKMGVCLLKEGEVDATEYPFEEPFAEYIAPKPVKSQEG